ncbi:MAG: response regulator [Phyllobacterium sp.]
MPLSTRIAPHLPYLRRFARAASGSQHAGDSYVEMMLETLIADISRFPETSSDRISLYRLLLQVMQANRLTRVPESDLAWEQHAAAHFGSISSRARQAFLLLGLEGFGPAEAAEIMGTDAEHFSRLIDEASTGISQQIATSVMIIEDEPLIAMDIEQMVESLGHSVVGIARTRDEAVDLFKAMQPRIVLADVHLADGSSGIDAVNDILKREAIPVIFITAFPERLLTGKRPEPTFLVTKPFNPEMVKALITQALFFQERSKTAA